MVEQADISARANEYGNAKILVALGGIIGALTGLYAHAEDLQRERETAEQAKVNRDWARHERGFE
jgi:hypothetical protein